ncbi:MAG: potassium channel family protein [Prochlorotrichaceae cyanobacterium]
MPNQRYRQLQQQLIGATLSLGVILVIGTIGYALLEHWSILDAAYMTVITLSTVGFSETHPLSAQSRVFTIVLIFTGIANIGFLLNRFTDAISQGYFQDGLRLQRQERLINTLDQHYIICGFGRIGYQIALEFAAEKISFVVIDRTEAAIEKAMNLGYPAIQADASLDSTLQNAGIERAQCLVVTLSSDADNLYILLSAKTLNPHLRTIARATSEEATQKLQRAGADTVISPYVTGAKRMAAAALRPQVIDFLDGILTTSNRSFYLEEFKVQKENCPYVDKDVNIAEITTQSGALILAIGRKDGSLINSPQGTIDLWDGDTLICLGTPEQLRHLNQFLIPL